MCVYIYMMYGSMAWGDSGDLVGENISRLLPCLVLCEFTPHPMVPKKSESLSPKHGFCGVNSVLRD